MPNLGSVPDSWFEYEFPTVPARAAGVSRADYSPTNVAPLMESFGGVLGYPASRLEFRYLPDDPTVAGENVVRHPGGEHLGAYLNRHNTKSPELLQYERAAKGSARLKLYQDNSPADIEYFQDL